MREISRVLTIAVLALGLGSIPVLAQTNVARGGNMGGPPPVPFGATGDILSEDFVDLNGLLTNFDWHSINNSEPLGQQTDWFQGNTTVFPAHSGGEWTYVAANYQMTGPTVGDINAWLLTPVVDLAAAQEISFWTRTPEGSIWADRLELRICTALPCLNVGTGAFDVGDFDTLLLSVNPDLVPGPWGEDNPDAYPEVWTQYVASQVGGFGSGPGRIAFRYNVPDGGPSGTNSNFIGVDTLQVSSETAGGDGGGGGDGGVPATTTWGVIILIAMLLGVSLLYRRRGITGA